jgi:hypothetical protein
MPELGVGGGVPSHQQPSNETLQAGDAPLKCASMPCLPRPLLALQPETPHYTLPGALGGFDPGGWGQHRIASF